MTTRAKRISLSVLLGVFLVPAGAWFLILRPPAEVRELWSIQETWDDATPETQNASAARCLDLHRRYPNTKAGLAALMMASIRAPDAPAGRDADAEFLRQIESADPALLVAAFDWNANPLRPIPRFAAPLLVRARRTPDQPHVGGLMGLAAVMAAPKEGQDPPPVYTDIADLIAERFAASPDIGRFCNTVVGPGSPPPWAARYEPHLREIVGVNRDRWVRCSALYALASVVLAGSDDRQTEALELFEQFCAEFDGTHAYEWQQPEQVLVHEARTELHNLRFHAVGHQASDIVGTDLNDKPLKLSDRRGRVVLLNFWGTWCFPCMKLIPHEKELAERHRGRPFDLIGINCDDDIEKAREAVARTGMTWPSFRNEAGGRPAITKDWKILGFPTLYLIDHHGVIRKRWVGAPTPEELGHAAEVLVAAAEKQTPADGMKAIAAALSARAAVPAANPAAADRPAGTFADKVCRDADGSESKYTAFVPPGYDGAKPAPAVLFLHGAGPRGADGKAHLQYGLAKVIREQRPDFPFVVVFPQARVGEDWSAGSPGGRRALAILAHAQSEYRIDPDRVALCGVSMGGAGTWSLAAAEPGRWSAIVPICHGGDPAGAAKLAGIPCWCFHGAADRVIPPQQSRDMVEAIAAAGGKPLYQEFPGVGHDDCADRAFAAPDVVEWLSIQNRTKR